MTDNELANLKIARKWLDVSGARESALELIDGLIEANDRERLRSGAASGDGGSNGRFTSGAAPISFKTAAGR